jgi:hypothetical protein
MIAGIDFIDVALARPEAQKSRSGRAIKQRTVVIEACHGAYGFDVSPKVEDVGHRESTPAMASKEQGQFAHHRIGFHVIDRVRKVHHPLAHPIDRIAFAFIVGGSIVGKGQKALRG